VTIPFHLPHFALAAIAAAVAARAEDPAWPVAPGAKLVCASSEFQFAEGPACDRDGSVLFTDQPNDRIVRWRPDGTVVDWLKPAGRSNGTHFDRDGNLVTCADELNALWRISPDKKHIVLISDYQGKLLNGPNDVWISPKGPMYITDPLYPRDYWKRSPERQQPGEYVYYFNPETKELRPVETTLNKPNGIAGTPDGRRLYVADIGAGKTYLYDIEADGSLANRKLFCEMGSDGMTLDDEGNVYLTGHGVTVFDRTGRKLGHIDVPEHWTGNITFAGTDRKTLFITASKSIYTLQMRVPGSCKRDGYQ
jgi:gluconolactonase